MSVWQLFEVGEVQITFFAKLLESYLQGRGGKKKEKKKEKTSRELQMA